MDGCSATAQARVQLQVGCRVEPDLASLSLDLEGIQE